MLKKVLILTMVFMCVLGMFFMFSNADSEYDAVIEQHDDPELVQMRESTAAKLEGYVAAYGSYPYGVAAAILNIVRIYSIPFCFVGIALGSIYQYVIGIRRLDVRDRGFHLIITFVTILVICQILPLLFAVIVTGWRS